MRLFYTDEKSFCLLKFIDEDIINRFEASFNNSSITNILESSETNNSAPDPNRATGSKEIKTWQQTYIFNNSFQLDQVILALNNDVCTAIGRPIQVKKIVEILDQIDRRLLQKGIVNSENKSDLVELVHNLKHCCMKQL